MMLEKMEIGERIRVDEQRELREKIEGTLSKLHELKARVAELKRKCEELRLIELERFERVAENMLQCDKCGRALDPEERVVIKDANGEERRHYHKECFQTLFK